MLSNEPLDRIVGHVEKLRTTTRRGFRLMRWRLIIRLAQDEFDKEIEQFNELKTPMADPIFSSGAPIE